MSIAERARELSSEFCRWAATETPMDDLAAEHLALKFEQALLAERKSVWEQAANIVDDYWMRLTAAALMPAGIMSRGDLVRGEVAQELAQELRSVAEKDLL